MCTLDPPHMKGKYREKGRLLFIQIEPFELPLIMNSFDILFISSFSSLKFKIKLVYHGFIDVIC